MWQIEGVSTVEMLGCGDTTFNSSGVPRCPIRIFGTFLPYDIVRSVKRTSELSPLHEIEDFAWGS